MMHTPNIVPSAAGAEWRDVIGKRKFPWLVAVRAYIARGLRAKGFDSSTIGMVINRDRMTVIHLLGK